MGNCKTVNNSNKNSKDTSKNSKNSKNKEAPFIMMVKHPVRWLVNLDKIKICIVSFDATQCSLMKHVKKSNKIVWLISGLIQNKIYVKTIYEDIQQFVTSKSKLKWLFTELPKSSLEEKMALYLENHRYLFTYVQ